MTTKTTTSSIYSPIPLLDLKAQYASLRAGIQAAIERVLE